MAMTSPEAPSIRRATEQDADAISRLTRGLSERWIAPDCSVEGAQRLIDSMAPVAIAGRLREGHLYWIAEDDGEVVGVSVIRLPRHLYHLFVAERMQRRGLARALWLAVRDASFALHGPDAVTVKASRHALAMYEKLGFVVQGPEQSRGGIVSTPMLWMP